MVLLHHRPHLLQCVRKAKGHILTVAQRILPVADDVLGLRRQHHLQHPHGLFPARLILFQFPVQRHLKIRRCHKPLFAILTEKRQKHRVDARLPEQAHPCGGAEIHGKLAVLKQLGNRVIVVIQVLCSQMYVPDELLHALKGPRPHRIIQAHTLRIGGVAVSGAPLASRRGGKRRGRQPL